MAIPCMCLIKAIPLFFLFSFFVLFDHGYSFFCSIMAIPFMCLTIAIPYVCLIMAIPVFAQSWLYLFLLNNGYSFHVY